MTFGDEELEGRIAIIGYACRFPGAGNATELWENLAAGRPGIRPLNDSELGRLPGAVLEDPRHVPVQGVLDEADRFDAGFFGFTPREARDLHPSHRLFFQCGVQALEHAGLDPDRYGEGIGVFAGMESYDSAGSGEAIAEGLHHAIHTGVDYLTTRLSYLLDLRGPSVPIQTACSTSLVAVHMAVQSLLDHQCDAALAGGSSVPLLGATGYLHQEGGIYSPDGACRAFDERAQGTVPGSGVGLVVLRRLADALAEGDHVHAVIHGTAVNNDGSGKVGFTAPSIEGQRRVVEEAQTVADVEPGKITYVECHGTATPLGDAVEVDALTQVFEGVPQGRHCGLGSIKTSLGHCGAAAGVAGLIKTALCLEHATLVPSLSYERPSSRIALENSPFYVVTERTPWEAAERWAGVSSFGIGGTNAHVVLGGAPRRAASGPDRGRALFVLSAASEERLERRAREAMAALDAYPENPIADLAFTLKTGRRAMKHRWWFLAADREELRRRLAAGPEGASVVEAGRKGAIAFLFPGQGRFLPDLGRELYGSKPVFRDAVDEVAEGFAAHLDADPIRRLAGAGTLPKECLVDPLVWQPALFAAQIATARWWSALGVEPRALLGHSLGEFAAATLAGVLTLEGAIELVAARARATAETAPGRMIAVHAGAERLEPYARPPISLAAVNGSRSCVLSGPAAEIDRVEKEIAAAGLRVTSLEGSHAFHSRLMEPLRQALDEAAGRLDLGAPRIPMVSNVTGDWLEPAAATDPTYWGRQALETVRFHDGLRTLAADGGIDVALEVGPGNVLTRLVRASETTLHAVASSGRGASDSDSLARAAAALWSRGTPIDWGADEAKGKRQRLSIVTDPFECEVYPEPPMIPPGSPSAAAGTVTDEAAPRCYVPRWEQTRIRRNTPSTALAGRRCLVLDDPAGDLGTRLEAEGARVVRVQAGPDPPRGDSELSFTVDPTRQEDFRRLRGALDEEGFEPDVLVQGWGLEGAGDLRERLWRTLGSTLHLVRSFATAEDPPVLTILTRGHHPLGDEAEPRPEISALAGLVRMLEHELPAFRCRWLDGDGEADPPPWLAEIASRDGEPMVAWRRGKRWVPGRVPTALGEGAPSAGPRPEGTTLVVDGLGPPGLELATRLAAEPGRSVILVDRAFFPPPPEWDDWIANQGEDDPIARAIAKIRPFAERIEIAAGEAGTEEHWSRLAAGAAQEGRAIDQVFVFDRAEAAARLEDAEISPLIQRLGDRFEALSALRRVMGSAVEWIFCAADPDRARHGEVARLAFGAWLDDLADHAEGSGSTVVAVDADPPRRADAALGEWLDALERAVASGHPRLALATDGATPRHEAGPRQASEAKTGRRPELSTPYQPPEDDVSRVIVEIWERYFGLEGIGVHDDFFELGGHSLLAVQVLEQLAETFAAELTIDVLFDHPTAHQLAEHLQQGPRDDRDEAVAREILDQLESLDPAEVEALLGE